MTAAAAAAGVWCYRCGSADPDKLYAHAGAPWGVLCADCWHRVGCPFPRHVATAQESHETEERTRDRMLARGGTDRHLVRSGRT